MAAADPSVPIPAALPPQISRVYGAAWVRPVAESYALVAAVAGVARLLGARTPAEIGRAQPLLRPLRRRPGARGQARRRGHRGRVLRCHLRVCLRRDLGLPQGAFRRLQDVLEGGLRPAPRVLQIPSRRNGGHAGIGGFVGAYFGSSRSRFRFQGVGLSLHGNLI